MASGSSSESEESFESFDCSGLPHTFDLEENCDRHQRPGSTRFTECDFSPCPNRYSGTLASRDPWGIPPASNYITHG